MLGQYATMRIYLWKHSYISLLVSVCSQFCSLSTQNPAYSLVSYSQGIAFCSPPATWCSKTSFTLEKTIRQAKFPLFQEKISPSSREVLCKTRRSHHYPRTIRAGRTHLCSHRCGNEQDALSHLPRLQPHRWRVMGIRPYLLGLFRRRSADESRREHRSRGTYHHLFVRLANVHSCAQAKRNPRTY